MNFSVVIPVLNEERTLRSCLDAAYGADRSVEIIVVDGGSNDRTREIAIDMGAVVHESAPGRGNQQNSGARIAAGDVLLFLHADTLLPHNAFDLLRKEFSDPYIQIGTFRSMFNSDHPVLAFYSFFTRFETRFTSFGDQCIAVRSEFFRSLGGFPDWPLFEDMRLLEIARKRTSVQKFAGTVTTSARMFLHLGPIRQQLQNAFLILLYQSGISPFRLAQWYYRHQNNDVVLKDVPLQWGRVLENGGTVENPEG